MHFPLNYFRTQFGIFATEDFLASMLNQIFGNRSSDYKLFPKEIKGARAIIGWLKPRHQAF